MKNTCHFCGGPKGALTVDDSRGNCSACGAPRVIFDDPKADERTKFAKSHFGNSLLITNELIDGVSDYAKCMQSMYESMNGLKHEIGKALLKNGDLYLGGEFTRTSTDPRRVAVWNDDVFSALQEKMTNDGLTDEEVIAIQNAYNSVM